MSRARHALVLVGALIGLVLVAAMLVEVARRGRFAVPLSTYSTAPAGTKALFRLARGAGLRPRRWMQDFGRGLPRGRGVIVATGSAWDEPARPLGRAERAALMEWIEGGGTLVVLGATEYLPTEAGAILSVPVPAARKGEPRAAGPAPLPWRDPELVAEIEARDVEVHAQAFAHALVRGLGTFTFRGPGNLKLTLDDWEHVLGSPKDDLLATRRHGRGRIVVAASAWPATNLALAQGDHAALLLRVLRLGRGPLYFDEYHLGMGSSRSVAQYLRERGMHLVLGQVLLAVLLLLWRAGARFGAPASAPAPAPHDATSYVDALGRIYARAGDVRASLQRVLDTALKGVATRHGLGREEPAALARALRDRGRGAAADGVEQARAQLEALHQAQGALGPRHLIDFEKAVDRTLGEDSHR